MSEAGKEQWKRYNLAIGGEFAKAFPATDSYKGPLWELMEIFGPAICHGGSDQFFVDNRLTIRSVE